MSETEKHAVTSFPIHPLLAARWSPRAFADRAIPPEDLGSLLEAARWAPSSRNLQPWRFVVADRHRDPQGFARILAALMEGNQVWAQRASLLLVACTQPAPEAGGRTNRYAEYDVGQAMAHFTIQAMACGLHVHQMGGFRRDEARAALDIPDEFEPVVSAAVGYLDAPTALPDDVAERERLPRSRHPLSQVAFRGRWGKTDPDLA